MDIDLLQAEVRRGTRFRYLYFWGHTPKTKGAMGPWVFSQWYPAPFEVDGVRYPTAEHYMMAAKARLFGDEEALQGVLTARSPAAAKAWGRKVRGFDEATWRAHRMDIVQTASVAKFSADPDLRATLLRTGTKVLVEASPVDRIWGVGLAADDPKAKKPLQWRGLNLLGFALMHARTVLGSS